MQHLPTHTVLEQTTPAVDRTPRPARPAVTRFRLLSALLLLLAAVCFALHFVHLTADFPNYSRWMDWSKYTDEGWYGDAAIRHMQLGHWYAPGDFNPAVALPVWPLLEVAVFRVAGASLVSARALTVAVFGLTLLVSWLLIARRRTPSGAPEGVLSLPAAAAVLLLAASPFCFVFTRLAILEPLLVLLGLCALLAADAVVPATGGGLRSPSLPAFYRRNALPLLALALLLPAMVLTKTTGLFLVPAVLWMLFAALEYHWKRFASAAAAVAVVSVSLWLAYFVGFVRPRYLLDYRYLFSANAYTGITRANFFATLWWTLHGGFWAGHLLYALALLSVLLAALRWRSLRETPLIPALLLWAFGYAAFLAYHNNLQPRYYLVIVIPLTLLVPVVAADLLLPACRSVALRSATLVAIAIALTLVLVSSARQTLGFVLHPEYTFVNAARASAAVIRDYDRAHPGHSPLVLSISGADLSLITGVPSICDDFGTDELGDRVQKYRPGWYLAWNQIDDDKMDALDPLYRAVRVAAYPAFDDPDRNLLIVYRLDPAGDEPKQPLHRRKPIPRKLQTRVGQQPTTEQLEH